jgi:hypothetical protein
MAKATTHPNHSLISSEDVEGTNVYDMKGTQIGEIDHLDDSGRVTYAVMSFGSFLGLGHSHYPIPGARSSTIQSLGRAQVRHQSRRLSHERHRAAAQRRPRVK